MEPRMMTERGNTVYLNIVLRKKTNEIHSCKHCGKNEQKKTKDKKTQANLKENQCVDFVSNNFCVPIKVIYTLAYFHVK